MPRTLSGCLWLLVRGFVSRPRAYLHISVVTKTKCRKILKFLDKIAKKEGKSKNVKLPTEEIRKRLRQYDKLLNRMTANWLGHLGDPIEVFFPNCVGNVYIIIK